MIGAIIGDIVGSRFEFNNIRIKEFELITSRNEFTDDSVLTIALMDWILHSENKNIETASTYLQKWARRYPHAGYGGRFFHWIYMEHPTPYNSYGNGSAMRISPIAYAYHKDINEEMKMMEIATSCTHNHIEGIKGARAVCHSISMALNGATKKEIEEYVLSEYPEIASFDYEDLRKNYRFNETCQGSVPQALYCFLISKDFEDCLRTTISIGGDCDTTAAMSSAIAEAYYKEIPEELVNKARSKLTEEQLQIVDEFQRKYPLK